MSFFSRLAELVGEDYIVQIAVQKKGNSLSVSILPKSAHDKSTTKGTIVPIVISGSPDQIDQGIISAIAQPIQSLNQLVVSGDAFVKQEKKSSKPTTVKTEPKKEESKKEENTLQFDSPSKPAIVGGKASSSSSGDVHIEAGPKEEPDKTDGSLEESTGDAELGPGDLVEETASKTEPVAAEDGDDGQNVMFDDEDWA